MADIFGKIKKEIFFLGTLLFLFTRLINLTLFPIFNDEAIYLHWGLSFYNNLGKDIPQLLTVDGKQAGIPIVYGFLQKFPFDPLMMGRLFSVMFSMITFITVIKIYYYSNAPSPPLKVRGGIGGVITLVLLFIFCPYLLFFDRLSLPESIITACYVLSMLLTIYIAESPSVKKSILLGAVLAFGWWFKSGILLAIPCFLIILFINWYRKKLFRQKYLISLITALVTFALLIIPLIIQPDYQRLAFMEGARINSPLQILKADPFIFWEKIKQVFFWLIFYVSPFSVLPFLYTLKQIRKDKFILYISVFFFIPIILEVFFLNIFTSRYLVFIVPAYLLIIYKGFNGCHKLIKTFSILSLVYSVILSLVLIFAPQRFYALSDYVPIVKSDLYQYFDGWTSGFGIKEAADWLIKDAGNKKTAVFVRFDSGNPEDAMYVYLNHQENIKVIPVNFIDRFSEQKDINLYYVSRSTQMAGLENKAKELVRFKKPFGNEYIGVYKVN